MTGDAAPHGIRWRLTRRWHAVAAVVRLTHALHGSILFDRDCYQAQIRRRFATRWQAAFSFVLNGSRLGIAAGPLMVLDPSAMDRPSGVGPAGHWAALVLDSGLASRHPLIDTEWYAAHVPEAADYPGGALAHYMHQGRFNGARLSPRYTGNLDLVEVGVEVLTNTATMPRQLWDAGSLGTHSAGLVGADPRSNPATTIHAMLDEGLESVAVVMSAEAQGEERLTAFALAQSDSRIFVTDVEHAGRVAASCAAVLVGTAHLNVASGTYGRLLEAVHSGAADVAAPVILETDDTIRDGGRDAQGTRLLGGLPWADAIRAGNRRVDGTTALLVAVGKDALSHFEPRATLRDAIEMTTARAANGGLRVTVLADAAAGLVPLSLDALRKRPPLAEPPRTGKQRWAIKSPHPAGLRRETWGDWHFAQALARALEQLGHEVAIDPFHSWYRPSSRFDDVTVTIRGLRRYEPTGDHIDVLWVISHPELLTDEELADFDVVAAASRTWAASHSSADREVLALLQCTDAERFRPDGGEPGTGYPLFFVGNSRSAPRPLIDAAGATRPELRVIGGGWQDRMPPGVVVAEHVPNEELPALYRSAGVVLNDHWATMAAEGFISNRLFDLTAAGARWISDPVDGLLDVLPTGRTARDADELAALLDAGPEALPTEPELQAASAMVRAEHSFAARARQLSQAVESVRAKRAET